MNKEDIVNELITFRERIETHHEVDGKIDKKWLLNYLNIIIDEI